MKILTSEQIREADVYTISHEPVTSAGLMERAAAALSHELRHIILPGTPLIFFCGNGNNGGDGLAMARMLAPEYPCSVYILPGENYSPDFLLNRERLENTGVVVTVLSSVEDIGPIPTSVVVVDALFGSGLNRPLQGMAADVVTHINTLHSGIISIDIPSGLFGEWNMETTGKPIIQADITLTIQQPRLSFFFPENYRYTGDFRIVDIGLHPDFMANVFTPYIMLEKEMAAGWVGTRNKFAHKGDFGHAWIIGGEKGKCGAPVLSSMACLRSGAGLLTSIVPECCVLPLHTAFPEAMIWASGETELSSVMPKSVPSAIGMGPGTGKGNGPAALLKLLLQESPAPLVLDADALNILADNPTWLAFLPQDTILTPHPGEFDRLTRKHSSGEDRFRSLQEFSSRFNCVVVLKGAYTAVALPSGKVFFNSTGHPGMATAGSGDVLTGIITGLLSQGYEPGIAACLGVYLHGLAGELALQEQSEESMVAGDIITLLGKAFQSLKEIKHQKLR